MIWPKRWGVGGEKEARKRDDREDTKKKNKETGVEGGEEKTQAGAEESEVKRTCKQE